MSQFSSQKTRHGHLHRHCVYALRMGWDSNPRIRRSVVFKTTALNQLCDLSLFCTECRNRTHPWRIWSPHRHLACIPYLFQRPLWYHFTTPVYKKTPTFYSQGLFLFIFKFVYLIYRHTWPIWLTIASPINRIHMYVNISHHL